MSQSELSTDEKAEAFARFEDALLAWISEADTNTMSIHDVFYAGYKAGYGHAKDDANELMRQT